MAIRSNSKTWTQRAKKVQILTVNAAASPPGSGLRLGERVLFDFCVTESGANDQPR
jgi:hypothetical protein